MTVEERLNSSQKRLEKDGKSILRNIGKKITSPQFSGKVGKIVGYEISQRDGFLRYVVWFKENNSEETIIIGSKFQPDYVFVK